MSEQKFHKELYKPEENYSKPRGYKSVCSSECSNDSSKQDITKGIRNLCLLN